MIAITTQIKFCVLQNDKVMYHKKQQACDDQYDKIVFLDDCKNLAINSFDAGILGNVS